MYSINVKPGEGATRDHRRAFGGIEVTTEMIQESTKHPETISERSLVSDASSA